MPPVVALQADTLFYASATLFCQSEPSASKDAFSKVTLMGIEHDCIVFEALQFYMSLPVIQAYRAGGGWSQKTLQFQGF